jgi:hypothetical protein
MRYFILKAIRIIDDYFGEKDGEINKSDLNSIEIKKKILKAHCIYLLGKHAKKTKNIQDALDQYGEAYHLTL